jgi:hypothetical protein
MDRLLLSAGFGFFSAGHLIFHEYQGLSGTEAD